MNNWYEFIYQLICSYILLRDSVINEVEFVHHVERQFVRLLIVNHFVFEYSSSIVFHHSNVDQSLPMQLKNLHNSLLNCYLQTNEEKKRSSFEKDLCRRNIYQIFIRKMMNFNFKWTFLRETKSYYQIVKFSINILPFAWILLSVWFDEKSPARNDRALLIVRVIYVDRQLKNKPILTIIISHRKHTRHILDRM